MEELFLGLWALLRFFPHTFAVHLNEKLNYSIISHHHTHTNTFLQIYSHHHHDLENKRETLLRWILMDFLSLCPSLNIFCCCYCYNSFLLFLFFISSSLTYNFFVTSVTHTYIRLYMHKIIYKGNYVKLLPSEHTQTEKNLNHKRVDDNVQWLKNEWQQKRDKIFLNAKTTS